MYYICTVTNEKKVSKIYKEGSKLGCLSKVLSFFLIQGYKGGRNRELKKKKGSSVMGAYGSPFPFESRVVEKLRSPWVKKVSSKIHPVKGKHRSDV